MPEASSAVITTQVTPRDVKFGTVEVEGLKIAYREAGDPKAPKLVLLHGFPASSHQYRNLVPALADRFHVIAPDYPGFGESDAPDPASWAYTFDHLAEVTAKFLSAKGFTRYGLFAQDYGGPVGFRIVDSNPAALEWLIVQNTNAYQEGFTKAWDGLRGALWTNRSHETEKPLEGFLTRDAIKSFYVHGSPNPELIGPDNWNYDFGLMTRPHSVGSISTCSTIIAPTSICIRSGKRFCAKGNRKPLSSGARTTSFSREKAARRICATYQRQKFTGWPPVTSLSRTTSNSSLHR